MCNDKHKLVLYLIAQTQLLWKGFSHTAITVQRVFIQSANTGYNDLLIHTAE